MYKTRVEARDGMGRKRRTAVRRSYRGDDCALADEIDRIRGHGFKDLGGVLQSSACTGGAERESGTTAYVEVLAFAQKLYDLWHLTGILEQQEVSEVAAAVCRTASLFGVPA